MSGERNVASQIPERKVDPERVKIAEEYGQLGYNLLGFGWEPTEIREVLDSDAYPTRGDIQYLFDNNAGWIFNATFSAESYDGFILQHRTAPGNNRELADAIIAFCEWRKTK